MSLDLFQDGGLGTHHAVAQPNGIAQVRIQEVEDPLRQSNGVGDVGGADLGLGLHDAARGLIFCLELDFARGDAELHDQSAVFHAQPADLRRAELRGREGELAGCEDAGWRCDHSCRERKFGFVSVKEDDKSSDMLTLGLSIRSACERVVVHAHRGAINVEAVVEATDVYRAGALEVLEIKVAIIRLAVERQGVGVGRVLGSAGTLRASLGESLRGEKGDQNYVGEHRECW